MMFTNSRSLGGVASIAALSASAIACSLHAQTAVQWRVADGGNGHWYQRVETPTELTWIEARDAAQARSGYLITLASADEQAWMKSRFIDGLPYCTPASWANKFSVWIGFWQDVNAPSYSEPHGGWRWVSNEPVTWTGWLPGEPNNGVGAEYAVTQYETGGWIDEYVDLTIYCVMAYVVEWSADCNNDGIVDYG